MSGIKITAITGPMKGDRFTYKTREPPKVELSYEEAENFLQHDALLREMRETLGNESADVKSLEDLREQEIENLGRLQDLEVSILPKNEALVVGTDPNMMENLQRTAQDTATRILDSNSSNIINAENFDAMTPRDQGNIRGVAFEGLGNGRAQATMEALGNPVDIKDGDGNGIIPVVDSEANVRTPKYSDGVFWDPIVKELKKVTQAKFSSSPEGLQKLIEKHFRVWLESGDPVSNHPQLQIQNVDVIVPPDMVDGENRFVRVNVKLEDGKVVSTDIEMKTTVDIDRYRIKMLTTEEVGEYITENFPTIKDLAPVHEKLADLRENLKKLETRFKELKSNYHRAATNDRLRKLYQDKQKEIIDAYQELDKYEENYKRDVKKIKSTDKTQRSQYLKGLAVQVGISGAISGLTTLITSLDTNLRRWKANEIDSKELWLNVGKDTVKSTLIGGCVGLAAAVPVLGPGLLVAGIGMESYAILKSYNQGTIGSGEMLRQGGRMVGRLGGLWGAACLMGPFGICVGVAACIAVGVGDYYLGDKVASLFIKDDEDEIKAMNKKKIEDFEEKTLEKAYALFDLTKHCTVDELEERKKIAYRKYHPDKNPGCSEEEKKQNALKFQAVFAAYTLIKQVRGM